MSETVTKKRPKASPTKQNGGGGLGGKLLFVIIVAAVSFIPLLIVGAVLGLRADYATRTVVELEQSVGGRQSLLGPVVVVPVNWDEDSRRVASTEDGLERVTFRERPQPMIFVPDDASFAINHTTTTAEASVYSAIAYEAVVDVEATFDFSEHPPLEQGQIFEWDSATIVYFLGNTRSARFRPELTVGEDRQPLYASLGLGTALSPRMVDGRDGNAGFSAIIGERINKETPGRMTFATKLGFGGATRSTLAPMGRDTRIQFTTDRLPTRLQDFRSDSLNNFASGRAIESGLVGPYSTLPQGLFNRDLADRLLSRQQWQVFYESTDARPYQDLFRALRYGFFLLGFSFLTLFIFDATARRSLHPGQYFLLGLIQSVFYAFLLAVSEFTGFELGFIIAAVPTVLVTGYTLAAVFRSIGHGIMGLLVFGAFYAVQYFLMDQAEYALLVAAGAAFSAIAISIVVTARLDWDKFDGSTT
ncbi:MAG: inner membrane CreD family protein [Pseudomonadota bacterium]